MTEKKPKIEASPRKAQEIWNQLSAVLESTACQFDIIRPILLKAEKYYVDVDPVLALFVHGILLKEAGWT